MVSVHAFKYSFKYSFSLVPYQPVPPVVGKVTYHTIELYWDHTHTITHLQGEEPSLTYCVQEQDVDKNDGFVTVYE